MNGKERMALAMQGKPTDRTPLMCQFSLGYMAKNFVDDPIRYWYTSEGLAEAYIAAAEYHHFDGILLNILGRDPVRYQQIVSVEDLENGDKIVTWEDGEQHLLKENDDPKRISPYVDPRPSDIEDVNLEDIELLTPETIPSYLLDVQNIVMERKGKELSIHGEIASAFDEFLVTFDSLGNGLMALLDDPDKAHEILERHIHNVIMKARVQCAGGVDAFKISSPFAGAGFISRGMYEEFVLPYEKKLIDMVHEEFGIPVYIHTCGAIGDRLDLMLATGADGLECLDPPPIGTVDLQKASEEMGNRAFIKGNLDSVNELLGKTPEEVLEIAKKRLEIGQKHEGGYILSTACSIAPDVPRENIDILLKAVEE